jgi:DNA repair protein REV1
MSDGAKPLTISRTSSDEYFVDDDPDFLEALLRAKLSGDVPECSEGSSLKLEEKVEETKQVAGIYESLKRKRSVSPDPNMPASQSQDSSRINGTDLDVYGASRFGHFGEYMRRKRAKLQIQNTHLQRTDEDSKKSAIFRGLAIYVSLLAKFTLPYHSIGSAQKINGWTDPSLQVLRQLIVQHGGVFHAYLDKKSLVFVFSPSSLLSK